MNGHLHFNSLANRYMHRYRFFILAATNFHGGMGVTRNFILEETAKIGGSQPEVSHSLDMYQAFILPAFTFFWCFPTFVLGVLVASCPSCRDGQLAGMPAFFAAPTTLGDTFQQSMQSPLPYL
jgi:hypothetical protein